MWLLSCEFGWVFDVLGVVFGVVFYWFLVVVRNGSIEELFGELDCVVLVLFVFLGNCEVVGLL